eukprot:TRINITY_DN2353_c0_g2_i1.p1 TRINITY_DN2353_c0_g2~~TRINITY_DN2353_c0_g2_i1.p1  ORF type:complete len:267 (+),score=72.25 TRINITY_DN2353_c0_g2_i1:89-802(+)
MDRIPEEKETALTTWIVLKAFVVFALKLPGNVLTTVVGWCGRFVLSPLMGLKGNFKTPGDDFVKCCTDDNNRCWTQDALQALYWSYLAYDIDIKDPPRDGWKLISSAATDTQVIVKYHEEERTLVVAWRGTELTYKDIVTDICFWKADPRTHTNGSGYEGVRVKDFRGKLHTGFYNGYLSVMYRRRNGGVAVTLAEEVERLVNHNSGLKVVVTGHSLGGALATLRGALQEEVRNHPV